MLEQLKYKNHLNEVFEFGKNGIFVNASDLHDYDWKTSSKGSRISVLTRQVSTRKLPVIIMCKTDAEGISARNRMLEVMEKDVLAVQHGQIIVGDYYFRCFVTKSAKKDYLTNKRLMKLTLTLTSDYPYWVKETRLQFRQSSGGGGGGASSLWLDFPYDYPFDYFFAAGSGNSNILSNGGFVATNFRMILYGSCKNPTISIAGHTYQVLCDVGVNEYLTIDSTTKKIQLVQYDGTVVNMFNNRNKASYIFQKIPAGTSTITWSGLSDFDIILMEERSEPKWI